MLISLTEYALALDKDPANLRHKAERGEFATARKIGRNWVIDSEEPYIDLRKLKRKLTISASED